MQPKLRFKGFTDEWEQRKLKVLGNIKRGASPRPISDPKWFDTNGKYGWLRISDVTSQNGQVFQINQHLSSIGEEKTVLISDPHLIISIAATVGKPCINYIPTAIHDGFVTFLDYKFNLDFMFEWFNKNQNIWLKYGQPGAQINLNSSIIGNQKIEIPKENEQEKIAKLFNILNNLLALYERKVELLTQIEKYLLDNLFAEKDYPNLRFKGFTDAWEQRKLCEENTITMGQSPSSKNYTDNPNDWILIQGNADLKNGKVSPRIYTSQITKKADIGDIILTVRAPVGEVAITDYNAVLGRGVAAIKGNQFIYYALEKFKENNKWNIYSSGSTFDSITGKDLNNLILSFPSELERNKIGILLKKLDSILTLYERKTKLIKQIQSNFLDQFFSETNSMTFLNQFLRIRNGYAFKSSELTETGEIPVVKISNIGNNKSFAFTTETKNKEQFTLYPNDIVIALSGATAGKINQVTNKYPLYYQNQRVGFFERKNNRLNYEYLNSFLHSKKFKSQLQKTMVAGAQPNIAPKDIEKIKIPFLEYELQQTIGQVNKSLFRLQKLNKRKVTVLNKIKNALLNTMFI